MLYNPPTGSTDPLAPYVGKNLVTGEQGSKVPPRAIEAPQREIVNVLVAAGLTPSATDNAQLLKVFGILSPRLVTNQTLYVRTDGNDANDGLENTSGKAFLTIAAAIAATAKLVATGAITIQLGIAGTYAAPGGVNQPGKKIILRGDPANQASYIVSSAGAPNQQPLAVVACSMAANGITFANTGVVADTVAAINGGSLDLTNCTFTSIGGNGNFHIAAFATGSVTVNSGCIFSSGMGGWLKAGGGVITLAQTTFTFSGAPAWSDAGVRSTTVGVVQTVGTVMFVGSATGLRYAANTNGIINSNGGGANFFPGSTAGTTDNGGQYV